MSSWNEQMVATSMYGTYDTVLTAVDTSKGNKVVGYCIFTAPCEDCELLRIAVDKEYRKHGIGSRMMKEMIRLCTEDDGEKKFSWKSGNQMKRRLRCMNLLDLMKFPDGKITIKNQQKMLLLWN